MAKFLTKLGFHFGPDEPPRKNLIWCRQDAADDANPNTFELLQFKDGEWKSLGGNNHEELTNVRIAAAGTNPTAFGAGAAWHLSPAVLTDLLNTLYPAAQPVTSLTVTPAGPLDFNGENITLTFSGSAAPAPSDSLSGIVSVKVQVSRNNVNWTDIYSFSAPAGIDTHTVPASDYTVNTTGADNRPVYFRLIAQTSRGVFGSALKTVPFAAYVPAAVTLTVTPPDTVLPRGNSEFTLEAVAARQTALAPVNTIAIQKSEDGGAWTTIFTMAAPGPAGGTTGPVVHTPGVGIETISFRGLAIDDDGTGYSEIADVDFQEPFFFGFHAAASLDQALVETLETVLTGQPMNKGNEFTLPANSSTRYVWLAGVTGNLPAGVQDVTNGNTVYTISAPGGAGDYFDMGPLSFTNATGFVIILRLLRSRNATSGYGGTTLKTI